MALPPVVKTPEERLDALELAKAASDAQIAALEKSNKKLTQGLYRAVNNQVEFVTKLHQINIALKLRLV